MYVKFKNPFNFEGVDHEGIDLDLDSLSGNDLEKAQDLALTARKVGGAAILEFNKAYCAQVAALAARQPVEFIRALPVREYVTVTLAVQAFLLDGASEAENTR
jgi:hypothetical protein